MKDTAKYVVTLSAFVAIAYALSWCAVYAFWIAAHLFQSVPAVRTCDALGSVILIPVRVLFWLAGDLVDQSTPLTDPLSYAAMNAMLLGILAYAACRRWIFGGLRSR